MKREICVIILFSICSICNSQNLVSNSSFEQYSGCPDDVGQIDSALYWTNPVNYPFSSSDYFNQCYTLDSLVGVPSNGFGYQQAHNGYAYSGICLFSQFASYREYIEASLTSSLIANSCYYFEMYISLGHTSKYTTDDIGVYFSDTLVTGLTSSYILPFTPQVTNQTGNYPDTLNWFLVSGNYTAHGGESYLIIGNFKDNANTDTILCNDSVWGGYSYVFIDDVSLSLCTGLNEAMDYNFINVFPNPFTNELNITVNSNELSEIILYDIASRKILHKQFIYSISLNTEQFIEGLFFYEVRNKNGLYRKGKVVKY